MALATASRDVPRWKSISGENSKLTSRSVGSAGLEGDDLGSSCAGLEESPSPYTSTRSGTPRGLVGPDVDPLDRRASRSAGTRRSPTRAAAGHPSCGQPAELGGACSGEHPGGQRRRDDVVVVGQRGWGSTRDQPRRPRLVDVTGWSRCPRAARRSHRWCGSGRSASASSRATRPGGRCARRGCRAIPPNVEPPSGKLERPLRADLAGPAGGGRAQHLTGQRGCVDVGVLRGPELQQGRGRCDGEREQRHDEPARRGDHSHKVRPEHEPTRRTWGYDPGPRRE